MVISIKILFPYFDGSNRLRNPFKIRMGFALCLCLCILNGFLLCLFDIRSCASKEPAISTLVYKEETQLTVSVFKVNGDIAISIACCQECSGGFLISLASHPCQFRGFFFSGRDAIS